MASSISTSSEAVFDFYCELCKEDGKTVEAEGYCVDCEDYLCGVCYTHHKRARPSRHHRLLDKENMPTATPLSSDKVSKDISTMCPQHKGETVKYYCKSHDELGCSACFAVGHRSCSSIECILDKSVGLLDGQEYQGFMKELKSMEQTARDNVSKSRDNVAKADNQYSEAMTALRQYREEISRILDALENDLKTKAEAIKLGDKETMRTVSDKCNSILKSVSNISSELNTLQESKKFGQMYITMTGAKRGIASLQTDLSEADKCNVVRMYKFRINSQLTEHLSKPNSLGSIVVQDTSAVIANQPTIKDPKDIQATYICDIDVKSSSDTKGYAITGSAVLSDNRLVIAERNNGKVKLLDTQSNKLISETQMSAYRYVCDIAVISTNQVAVTLHSYFFSLKKILILRVDNTLSIEREINVDSNCYGIAYSQDRLLVTYNDPSKLEIIDLSGNVIKTIANNVQGSPLFTSTQHVCVSNDEETIYVSDYKRNTVTRMTFDGTVKSVYSDSELKNPRKVCVDHHGNVYVCGETSNNLHMITADCVKIKIILKDKGGLQSVSHCRRTNRLFLGMENNKIEVYQLG